MSGEPQEPGRRRLRGRPRSREADEAIAAQALALLGERGLEGVTIDAVARRAGVARTTVYRRYRNRRDLLEAALAYTREAPAPAPEADIRTALELVLSRFRFGVEHVIGHAAAAMLLTESPDSPLVGEFRSRVIEPGRKLLRGVLQRGVENGELRADLDLELASDFLIGSYYARWLARGEIPADWARRAVDELWPYLRERGALEGRIIADELPPPPVAVRRMTVGNTKETT